MFREIDGFVLGCVILAGMVAINSVHLTLCDFACAAAPVVVVGVVVALCSFVMQGLNLHCPHFPNESLVKRKMQSRTEGLPFGGMFPTSTFGFDLWCRG